MPKGTGSAASRGGVVACFLRWFIGLIVLIMGGAAALRYFVLGEIDELAIQLGALAQIVVPFSFVVALWQTATRKR